MQTPSFEQLKDRMRELQDGVASGLLSEEDVAEEKQRLQAAAREWLRTSAAAAALPASAVAPPPLLSPLPAPPPVPPVTAPAADQATGSQTVPPGALGVAKATGQTLASLRKTLMPASAKRPAPAPAGSRSIMSFAGYSREVEFRGVRTAVLPVAVNVGRFACSFAPLCSFTTEAQNARAIHQRFCKFAPSGAAPGTVVDRDGEEASAGESESSDDDPASAGPAEKRSRASGPRIDGRRNNCGAKKRHSYTFAEKARILDEGAGLLDQGMSAHDVAATFGISESLLSKWRKTSEKIYVQAADDLRRSLTKAQLTRSAGSGRYAAMETKLVAEIRALRARGRHLSIRWLVIRARALWALEYPDSDETFMASRSWRRRFAKRHGLTRLKVSNTKSASVAERLPTIQAWHQKLARFVSEPPPAAPEAMLHSRWGRFLPENRFNMDEVGIAFVGDLGATYEFKGTSKVHVKTQAEGLSKRQATVALMFGPRPFDSSDNRVALIFRGKGVRIASSERLAYDPQVHVLFQERAWMDRNAMMNWHENIWLPLSERLGTQEKVLFLDNLDSHRCPDFLAALRESNTLARFLPPKCTDIVQPVDAGAGATFINLYTQAQDEWLDDATNLELWESGKLDASQRRILMTRWVGDAYRKFISAKYDNARLSWFRKTGCLMSADGTDDDLIKPEGTSFYTFERNAAAAADDDGNFQTAGEPEDEDESGEGWDAGFEPLVGVPSPEEQELGGDDPGRTTELVSFASMAEAVLSPGEQLRMLPDMPILNASLVGKRVAVRFVDLGWMAGTVCGTSSSSAVKSFNFIVRYDANDVHKHLFLEARYSGSTAASTANAWSGMDELPPGSWAVFATSVLPRAPQAGVIGGLRGAVGAPQALGAQRLRK